MSRIIIDQNLTMHLRDLLPGHVVTHAHEMGWDRLNNGELLNSAEQAGFDVMLTADQSIPRQNRMEARRIAVVILSTNRWPTIQQASDRILRALEGLAPGECRLVSLPRPPRRRHRAPGGPEAG